MPAIETAPTATAAQTQTAGSRTMGYYMSGAVKVDCLFDVANFLTRNTAGQYLLTGTGTAVAPLLAPSGDLDTGIFRAAARTIGFSAGGAEIMRVTQTGLGFGSTAPYAAIEIVKPAGEAAIGVGSVSGANNIGVDLLASVTSIPAPRVRAFIAVSSSLVPGMSNGDLLIAARTSAACNIRFMTGAGGAIVRWTVGYDGMLAPGADNAYDIATASLRARTYYGVTGAINTSDAREKTWRSGPSPAELAAARRIIGELGFYQWNDAIAEKGPDGARLHFGVRAQAVWAIMADEGLIDAIVEGVRPDSRYAFLCYDEWDEERGGDDNVIAAAGNRFGVRPDQLAMFLIAAQDARLAALEAA